MGFRRFSPVPLSGQSLQDFVFVYVHFNVPQIRITDLVGNVSDEKIY